MTVRVEARGVELFPNPDIWTPTDLRRLGIEGVICGIEVTPDEVIFLTDEGSSVSVPWQEISGDAEPRLVLEAKIPTSEDKRKYTVGLKSVTFGVRYQECQYSLGRPGDSVRANFPEEASIEFISK